MLELSSKIAWDLILMVSLMVMLQRLKKIRTQLILLEVLKMVIITIDMKLLLPKPDQPLSLVCSTQTWLNTMQLKQRERKKRKRRMMEKKRMRKMKNRLAKKKQCLQFLAKQIRHSSHSKEKPELPNWDLVREFHMKDIPTGFFLEVWLFCQRNLPISICGMMNSICKEISITCQITTQPESFMFSSQRKQMCKLNHHLKLMWELNFSTNWDHSSMDQWLTIMETSPMLINTPTPILMIDIQIPSSQEVLPLCHNHQHHLISLMALMMINIT